VVQDTEAHRIDSELLRWHRHLQQFDATHLITTRPRCHHAGFLTALIPALQRQHQGPGEQTLHLYT